MTPETFAAIMDRAYSQMRPWSAFDVARTLESDHTVLLSRASGGLIAQIVADECEILALATEPQSQRTGVASSLLADLLDLCSRSGVERVFLEVAERNTPARAFYGARGFAQVGKRPAYYTLRDGTRDDALLLSRSVAQGQDACAPTSLCSVTKSG